MFPAKYGRPRHRRYSLRDYTLEVRAPSHGRGYPEWDPCGIGKVGELGRHRPGGQATEGFRRRQRHGDRRAIRRQYMALTAGALQKAMRHGVILSFSFHLPLQKLPLDERYFLYLLDDTAVRQRGWRS